MALKRATPSRGGHAKPGVSMVEIVRLPEVGLSLWRLLPQGFLLSSEPPVVPRQGGNSMHRPRILFLSLCLCSLCALIGPVPRASAGSKGPVTPVPAAPLGSQQPGAPATADFFGLAGQGSFGQPLDQGLLQAE